MLARTKVVVLVRGQPERERIHRGIYSERSREQRRREELYEREIKVTEILVVNFIIPIAMR